MTNKTPFRKILVANRGEIALRIMRTAHAMGFRTVAVFSDADREARHVEVAHEAVRLHGLLPADSYLDIERVVAAARASGADAIHPGYGFLAENERFALACRDAGLVFIGPSPEAIAAMGDKGRAKRLMVGAGVPCIPGYDGEEQDDATLATEAEKLGFPVMIKATGGGGGRGMRLVQGREEFADALRMARSEARSAFGNTGVILERAIQGPRHVELQILADRYGNAIHLGERDCSVQRRHQKVIEESPSPAVSPALRERMGAAAVAAARAIRYEGAGTLEFLLDPEGQFFFMEMNARLQVEHPVTEAVTGLDLVELQLRVAAGEPLPIEQKDVTFTGHAIECRLCAESPEERFMPQSGTLSLWEMPTGVRVEHALESGVEISPWYDSMMAKLVSHGSSRDEARRKLASALGDAVALGPKTNQTFLARCLDHPEFAAGRATTAFVQRHRDELLRRDPEASARARTLATVLLYATASSAELRPGHPGIALHWPIAFCFDVDHEPCVATLVDEGHGRCGVTIADRTERVELLELSSNRARFSFGDILERAVFAHRGAELLVQHRGVVYRVHDRTHAPATRRPDAGGDGKIRASMTGRVVAVHVSVGDSVAAGQAVLTLEAMKMEHAHVAPIAGIVVELHAVLGEQVSAYGLVAEIATPAAAG
jgi:geranyl-CoA carboxylase alpha subunit